MYYGGFSYREAYHLPVAYKRWWIERITKELNKGGENEPIRSRGLQHNTPEVRELMGMHRTQSPARLQRFT